MNTLKNTTASTNSTTITNFALETFPGFYATIWDANYSIDEEELDGADIDYLRYENEVAAAYVDVYQSYIDKAFTGVTVSYDHISRPSSYNWSNDEIVWSVQIQDWAGFKKSLNKYINMYYSELTTIIEREFTGFAALEKDLSRWSDLISAGEMYYANYLLCKIVEIQNDSLDFEIYCELMEMHDYAAYNYIIAA